MKIGIDITSCYSADSLYGPENEKDMLGDICLATIIDAMIFSDSVVFPLPSKRGENPVDDPNFPKLLRTAYTSHNLVKAFQGKSAEDHLLTEDCYRMQFDNFKKTIANNLKAIRSLCELHFRNDKIVTQNRDWVPLKLPEGFFEDRVFNDYSAKIGLPNDRVRYLFDVFLRTIRYDIILRQGNYISSFHPFRNRAYLDEKETEKMEDVYSIGYYLSQIVKQRPNKYPMEKILDLTASVKETKPNDISAQTLRIENGSQAFQDLLADADFPVPLRDDIKRNLTVLSTTGASIIGLINPVIGVIVVIASAGIYFSSGEVPGKRMKIYRRFIDYNRFKKTM